MSWREFSYFINGLSGDTPLGRIVSIRAENDPEQIKQFTPEQKRIRNEYRRKQALTKTDNEVDSALDQMKTALLKMAK